MIAMLVMIMVMVVFSAPTVEAFLKHTLVHEARHFIRPLFARFV
jgi:hypothetical protein